MALRLKRGSTLRLHCVHSLGGVEVDLTGYTVTAAAKRGRGEPIALTVTVDPDQSTNPGVFVATADTEEWPTGNYAIDMGFDGPSTRYYSESFELELLERVTP